MNKFRLDQAGQKLVEENLGLVEETIFWNQIRPNDTTVGLSRDELIQEGYVWLCVAAATYQIGMASFRTYAKRVVRNGLISYCRRLRAENGGCMSLDAPMGDEGEADTLLELLEEYHDDTLGECVDFLESCKKNGDRRGINQRGLVALELRVAGLTGPEIAAKLSAPENHVRAWMSQTASKLRRDPMILWALKK